VTTLTTTEALAAGAAAKDAAGRKAAAWAAAQAWCATNARAIAAAARERGVPREDAEAEALMRIATRLLAAWEQGQEVDDGPLLGRFARDAISDYADRERAAYAPPRGTRNSRRAQGADEAAVWAGARRRVEMPAEAALAAPAPDEGERAKWAAAGLLALERPYALEKAAAAWREDGEAAALGEVEAAVPDPSDLGGRFRQRVRERADARLGTDWTLADLASFGKAEVLRRVQRQEAAEAAWREMKARREAGEDVGTYVPAPPTEPGALFALPEAVPRAEAEHRSVRPRRERGARQPELEMPTLMDAFAPAPQLAL